MSYPPKYTNESTTIPALPQAAGSELEIGTETQWGRVTASGWTGGERYYWLVDKHGCVAMMPAVIVEAQNAPHEPRRE